MNDHQKHRVGKLVVDAMFNTINNKKIAVLGFAFKADTGDTRESPAIDICSTLLCENAKVRVHAPPRACVRAARKGARGRQDGDRERGGGGRMLARDETMEVGAEQDMGASCPPCCAPRAPALPPIAPGPQPVHPHPDTRPPNTNSPFL
jgi:hypothetical protein